MQRKGWLGLTLAMMFLVVFAGFASASPDTFTIQVQATGRVSVAPTKAQMWVGAKTDGITAEETLVSSNETIDELVEIFAQFTSPQFIKTSEFNMYQRERWDDEIRQSIPEGFTVRHVFEVHILDLTQVAAFLDEITHAGANIIYGLQYGIQDHRPPQEAAFNQAMKEARWKAGLLAEANEASNLVLESVEETYQYGMEYGGAGGNAADELADSFMPGQLQISANILATFRAELPNH